ncbi:DUF4097 family beta strand repeat-containing protein [Aestuariibacter salexigens]|uniref:DUF4097 family beta strand repeat-containing protein n=1 Tax=Aestuariibacter salexigens TaxID=226010 RepID=UPI00040F6211|nr:DUF4097 family beta strand repeat-containing protein [Aestuariibacter salexigens]
MKLMSIKKWGWVVGFSLVSLPLTAGEKVDQTLSAPADGYVEIEHMNGRATIKGWDQDEVRVRGELGDRTEEFTFESDGNRTIIKVEVKRSSGWGGWNNDDGDRLEIYVPENSRIDYTSTNADVDVTGVYGGLDIDVVNGDMEIDDVAGRIRLESVNGDIEAKRLRGDLKAETVNGDIRAEQTESEELIFESVNGDIRVISDSRDIKAETVNGDVELTLDQVEDLNMTTVNGSLEATMNLLSGADVRATSVGGSISLYFQKDVSARFDIQAHAGGRINNDLTSDQVQKAKYGPSRWLEFSVNGGDGMVEISTVSGRVKVDRK